MLFNSIEFLVYLPLVFLGYWFLFSRLNIQNFFVLVVSYVFYGWWDWRFLILIAFTSFLSYISGVLIKKYDEYRKVKRVIGASNIAVNLLILGVFKYFNFFVENFEVLFSRFGIQLDWVTLNIVLPVGISFYTFQALSYSIDVYRGKIEPTRDIVAFFAYISFFPQLVAGPIERATNLLPQFYKRREFDYSVAVDGLRQMLYGFFKKIVIADNAAVCVNKIFENYSAMPASSLWLAAFLFSIQIYCDFSGYSDIAIGTARLFGFNLMTNFRYPYFSRDIAEFWRRWHISLTTWFRDYIYIPLGGSRVGKVKAVRNTFIIFLVSGFWHGANWTFLVWGFFHALLFVPLLVRGKNRRYVDNVAAGRLFPSVRELFQMGSTFILCMFLWIIFRSNTIADAYHFVAGMLDLSTLGRLPSNALSSGWGWYMLLLGFVALEWVSRNHAHGLFFVSTVQRRFVRYLIYALFILVLVYFSSSQPAEFIYFQF